MREAALAALLGSSAFGLRVMQADGDCLYSAISAGLGDGTTKDALRDVVASSLTADVFDSYRAVSCMPGYEWAAACATLEDARAQIRKPRLVWADENAIESLATSLGIALLIIDEEGVEAAGSKRGSRGSGGGGGSKFVVRGAQGPEDTVIALVRSRRQHFNLVTHSGSPNLGPLSALPPTLRAMFGMSAAAGGAKDEPPAAPPASKKQRLKSAGDAGDETSSL